MKTLQIQVKLSTHFNLRNVHNNAHYQVSNKGQQYAQYVSIGGKDATTQDHSGAPTHDGVAPVGEREGGAYWLPPAANAPQ